MAFSGGRIFRDIVQQRSLRRWARAARDAETADLSRLRAQRGAARQLRQQLDRLIHTAESRLALPMIGSNSFPRPHGSDWAWRPDLWRGPLPLNGVAAAETKTRLGDEVTLFHDCPQSELTLRQLRNRRADDLAPYGLRMDVFRFAGSFLSLVVDLPLEAVRDLKRRHLVRIEAIIELERPLEIFARLNIKNGPNVEQIVREVPPGSHEAVVEFDLAYCKLNEKRIDKMWLDLIFENPEMSQVTIRDLTFSRRPRADL